MGTASVEVVLPDGKVEHKYTYIPLASMPARRVERIPFSHPRQILPLLRVPPSLFAPRLTWIDTPTVDKV